MIALGLTAALLLTALMFAAIWFLNGDDDYTEEHKKHDH